MKRYQTTLLLAFFCLAILACNLPFRSEAINQGNPASAPTGSQTPSLTPISTQSPTITATSKPTLEPTLTETASPFPTLTFTFTPVPTYQVLRGEVMVDNVVCHYGPGAAYLYKYGLVAGSHLEIIVRIAQGKYLQVQAIGGNNPCWVNPDWMKVNGNLSDLRPVSPDDTGLPFTKRYKPPAGVSARRDGSAVTVSWAPVVISPGDDSGAPPYLIEAWVCQAGQIVFFPTGWRQTTAVIQDEPGCVSPSHARLYAVEKHGYTLWIEIPWPPQP
jgi:hypothetical protein